MREGHAGGENAIEETLEDCRKVEPPLRKYEDEPLRRFQPRDEIRHTGAVVRDIEVTGALGGGQARIEILPIEVQDIDRMASLFQRLPRRPGNRRCEALRQRMS